MWQYNNELYHYGVLGMKWGVRKDRRTGSSKSRFASSRKKRQSASDMSDDELQKKIKRKTLENSYNKLYPNKNEEFLKSAIDAANVTSNTAKGLNNAFKNSRGIVKKVDVDLSKMSDNDLRNAVNRYNLEKQYVNAFGKEEVSKGRVFTEKALSIGAGALAVTSSALSIALAVQQLKKKVY